MADSMCGPSNGAKNLLAHVDRDRTHHQDRLANAPQTGAGNVSIGGPYDMCLCVVNPIADLGATRLFDRRLRSATAPRWRSEASSRVARPWMQPSVPAWT